MKSLLLAALAALSLVSCNQNTRAKNLAGGGTATVELPARTKLITATWKDTELWYLTRPMRADETPETSTLHGYSGWGVIEGKVIFKEKN